MGEKMGKSMSEILKRKYWQDLVTYYIKGLSLVVERMQHIAKLEGKMRTWVLFGHSEFMVKAEVEMAAGPGNLELSSGPRYWFEYYHSVTRLAVEETTDRGGSRQSRKESWRPLNTKVGRKGKERHSRRKWYRKLENFRSTWSVTIHSVSWKLFPKRWKSMQTIPLCKYTERSLEEYIIKPIITVISWKRGEGIWIVEQERQGEL